MITRNRTTFCARQGTGMREIVTLNRELRFLLCLAQPTLPKEQINREGRGGFSNGAEKKSTAGHQCFAFGRWIDAQVGATEGGELKVMRSGDGCS